MVEPMRVTMPPINSSSVLNFKRTFLPVIAVSLRAQGFLRRRQRQDEPS